MKNEYSIQELTKEFDITARSIRFYEEKGLLSPSRKGSTRVFSAADRTRLKLIIRGKHLGLSLDESKEIIDLYNPDTQNQEQTDALIDAIDRRSEALKKQRKEIDLLLADLASTRALVTGDTTNKN